VAGVSSYPLLTDRLSIAPLGSADAEAFVAYRREPAVARFQGWDVDYRADDAARLVAGQPDGDLPGPGGWIQLAVRDRGADGGDEAGLLGDVAVHTLEDQPSTYELGVTLAPASQGRGFGTEAVGHVMDHLFRRAEAHRVVAFCDARNTAVARLLVRVGMRHEGRAVEADHFKGEWTSVDTYARLRREHLG
jgi:RimJ/RimL family protein N-acetyltransferase